MLTVHRCLSQQVRTRDVRGVTLFERRIGSGPPTVVLHGGPGRPSRLSASRLRCAGPRARADLLRPAWRRAIARSARNPGGLERAGGRSGGAPRSVGAGAADAGRAIPGAGFWPCSTPSNSLTGFERSRWSPPLRPGGRPGWSSSGGSTERNLAPELQRAARRAAERVGCASAIPRHTHRGSSSFRWPHTSTIQPERMTSRRFGSRVAPSRKSGPVWAITTSGRAASLSIPALVLHGDERSDSNRHRRVVAQLLGAEFQPLPHCGHVPYVEALRGVCAADGWISDQLAVSHSSSRSQLPAHQPPARFQHAPPHPLRSRLRPVCAGSLPENPCGRWRRPDTTPATGTAS